MDYEGAYVSSEVTYKFEVSIMFRSSGGVDGYGVTVKCQHNLTEVSYKSRAASRLHHRGLLKLWEGGESYPCVTDCG